MPSEIVTNWIADGKPATEPVTTETPVPVAVTEPIATETGVPRDTDSGKFVSPVAEPVPSPPAGATAAQVQEFIDAKLADGTAFQVPKGLTLPVKRNGVVEYDPIDKVLAERMMERDYRLKTTELGQQGRELQARELAFKTEQARVQARDAWLKEQEAQMTAAQKDPAAWAAYQQSMQLYQTNPHFRKVMDDALAKRETDAENQVHRQAADDQVRARGVELAVSWIDSIGSEPQFATVNRDRIRTLYAQALQTGTADLSDGSVRALYQQEAGYLAESTGPYQTQLATLHAQVAALTASQAAEKHNATTHHAVTRSKSPLLATTGNAPTPIGAGPVKPFGIRDLPKVNADWARQR